MKYKQWHIAGYTVTQYANGTIIESEYDVFPCQIDDPEKEPDKTGRVYARAKKFDLCKDCAREVMEVIE